MLPMTLRKTEIDYVEIGDIVFEQTPDGLIAYVGEVKDKTFSKYSASKHAYETVEDHERDIVLEHEDGRGKSVWERGADLWVATLDD